jgi:hypothetical protein
MSDIITAIDEVTAAVCGWCQEPLREDGPSFLYCDDECQWEYDQLQGERLVGYQEPVDLPMHVYNLHEEYSPEVTPLTFMRDVPLQHDWLTWDWDTDGEPLFPRIQQWMSQQFNAFWDALYSEISYTRVDPCSSGSPWRVVEQPKTEQMPDLPAVKAENLFTYSEAGEHVTATPLMPELPSLPAGFGYELIAEQSRRRERRRR